MKIALIGGRDNQQFPTIAYGGIETCVEQLAWGLHAAGADFSCIVPRRETRESYPFDIVESPVPPLSGPEINVWPFARSLPDLVRSVRPDVIWCQGFWAAETLQHLGIPIVCTFHDILMPGESPYQGWLTPRENTWYRFISKHQYGAWVDPAEDWQRQRCFQLYTGVSDEEYAFGAPERRGDYLLWVGGLKWGLQGKGLDVFIQLAVRCPGRDFVAFGDGHRELHEELVRLDRKLANFHFGGPLRRGAQHRTVFQQARLYIMPSKIPDTFPRTIVESLSKGTPVLGTCHGALPEMIGSDGGRATDDLDEMAAYIDLAQDYHRCYAYSQTFHIRREVDGMLAASRRIMGGAPSGRQRPGEPAA